MALIILLLIAALIVVVVVSLFVTGRPSLPRRLLGRAFFGRLVEEEWTTEPQPGSERSAALRYAARQYSHHDGVAKRAQLWFILFQLLTIGAAALATVLNVAGSLSDTAKAIPSAVATLSAAVLAAFHFRLIWRQHRVAARRIDFERLKFQLRAEDYFVEDTDPRDEREAVERFLTEVDAVSRAADADPEDVSAVTDPGGENEQLLAVKLQVLAAHLPPETAMKALEQAEAAARPRRSTRKE